MVTKTWVGGSGTWDNAADWSPQGVPGSADDVVLGAGANVMVYSGVGDRTGSVTLDDPSAVLNVIAGSGIYVSGDVTLAAGELDLTGDLGAGTLRLSGGSLRGFGTIGVGTLIGTITASFQDQDAGYFGLSLAGSITLAGGGGQPNIILHGATLHTYVRTTLDGGIVLAGSTDAQHPNVVGDFGAGGGDSGYTGLALTLGSSLTLDVTGLTDLVGAAPGTISANDSGTINVAPGGTLYMNTALTLTGVTHIASGTLDLSNAANPTGSFFIGGGGTTNAAPATNPIIFDDGAGKLILTNGQAVKVAGFRTGDTIDIKGVSVSGTLTPSSGGVIAVGTTDLSIVGQAAPGATYAATPDGSGGTLVTTTAQPAATVAFSDQTTGAAGSHAFDAASGGPSYLQWQYLDSGSDTVAMAASLPSVFLKGGSGEKALAVTSGQNVLDGGSGSSFLSGGSGTDTFFVDVRGSNQVWDTLTNFHAGDAVTIWGWTPGSGTETLDAQAGAAGYQGATLRLAAGTGGPTSSVTFAGMSADQVAHLQVATGTVGGLPSLYLYDPGV